VFYITFICVFSNTIQAQQFSAPKAAHFKLGVFAGSNYTSSFLDSRYFKTQAGFLAGVDIQYLLTSRSSLHLQPSWAQLANEQSKFNFGTLTLNTFKLPFEYRYYVSPGKRLLFVQGGLSYNYLTNSNYRKQYDIVCIQAPCPNTGPDTPSSNKSTVSGIAGIGINIELQKISIPITLQYERYFGNYLFSNNNFIFSNGEPTSIKFESFALTTGISF
jgi:hypothetical protein